MSDSYPIKIDSSALLAFGRYSRVHKKDSLLMFKFGECVCASYDQSTSMIKAHMQLPAQHVQLPVDDLGIADKNDFFRTLERATKSSQHTIELSRGKNAKGYPVETITVKYGGRVSRIKTCNLAKFKLTDQTGECDKRVPSPRGTTPPAAVFYMSKGFIKELCDMRAMTGNPQDFLVQIADTQAKIIFASDAKTESIIVPPKCVKLLPSSKTFVDFAREGVRYYASELITAMNDAGLEFEMEIACGEGYGQSIIKCYADPMGQNTLDQKGGLFVIACQELDTGHIGASAILG